MNSISPITVSIAEAARLVGIGRTSMYAAISKGKLAVRKSGRRTLVELEELQRFVTALPRNTDQVVP